MNDGTSITKRYHIFVLLMLSGGYMGAYSYYLKGGVFANAETANLLILAFNLAEHNAKGAIRVLIPITTFFIGSIFSQMFIEKLKEKWPPILVFSEIVLLSVLSILPEETPFAIFHVVIALMSSMQFNSFKEARGVPLSTLFCTAHLRGCGASLYSAIAAKDKTALKKSGYHAGMIITFLLGGIICDLFGKRLGTHAIAFSILPLIIVLIEILKAKKRSA